MKSTITLLLLLCLSSRVYADRLPYTSEQVEGATLIGVWGPRDIHSVGDSLRLKQPQSVLKGNANSLAEVKQYSSILGKAIAAIAKDPESTVKQRFILFIRIEGDTARLFQEDVVPYSDIAVKSLGAVITQLELKNRWTVLSTIEQIELSDAIVSGKVTLGEASSARFTLEVDKNYRGLPVGRVPGQLWVEYVAEKHLNLNALFFMQRQFGSGPDYVVMNVIPLAEAQRHLAHLKQVPIVESEPRRFDSSTGTVPPSDIETTSSLIAYLKNSTLRDDRTSARHRAAAIDFLGKRQANEATAALIDCLSDSRLADKQGVNDHAAKALSAINR